MMAGQHAAEVPGRGQSQLNVDVGQTQIAVEQQGALLGARQGVNRDVIAVEVRLRKRLGHFEQRHSGAAAHVGHRGPGFEPLYDRKASLRNLAGLGVFTPSWQHAKYPHYRSVGRFLSMT